MLGRIWNRFLEAITRAVPSKFFDPESGPWAVVVVDMQYEFTKNLHKDDFDKILHNQIRIIEYCSLFDIPVAVLEYRNEGRTIKPLLSHLRHVPRVRFIAKSRNNGFSGTCLRDILSDWKAESILLMGINASFCVKDTARGAVENGFRIATSGSLIANHVAMRRKKEAHWYITNGIYLQDCNVDMWA